MMKRVLLMLLLALPANSFAEENAAPPVPASLIWVKGEKEAPQYVTMGFIRPDKNTPQSKEGRVRVSMEPGCLLPEAIVKALPDNRFRIEFPEDEHMAQEARRLLGLKGKVGIIRYKHPEQPGQGTTQIVEVTEVEEKKPAK